MWPCARRPDAPVHVPVRHVPPKLPHLRSSRNRQGERPEDICCSNENDELSTSIDSQIMTQVLVPGCRTSNIFVVSESHIVPSGGNVAEHWLIDMSHVPESHAVVTIGHPWQVPEAHMSFVVAALPSSHLWGSCKCEG